MRVAEAVVIAMKTRSPTPAGEPMHPATAPPVRIDEDSFKTLILSLRAPLVGERQTRDHPRAGEHRVHTFWWACSPYMLIGPGKLDSDS
jgi:hypothetical protein